MQKIHISQRPEYKHYNKLHHQASLRNTVKNNFEQQVSEENLSFFATSKQKTFGAYQKYMQMQRATYAAGILFSRGRRRLPLYIYIYTGGVTLGCSPRDDAEARLIRAADRPRSVGAHARAHRFRRRCSFLQLKKNPSLALL